jgi:hypothetical protein
VIERGRAGALTSGAGLTAAWRERGRGRWAMLGFGGEVSEREGEED